MPYVYRYKDLYDEKFKYIGIVKDDSHNSLVRRIKQHRKDDWFKNSEYVVDYIKVPSRTDAEAIESSLIGKYETYKYYNKAKATWGESTLFSVDDNKWKKYGIESLQAIYRKGIESLEIKFNKLIKETNELKDENRILSKFVIKDGMHVVDYDVIEQSLKEKIDLYNSFAFDSTTKATAEKWAYRANRLLSLLCFLKYELLEHQVYSYSKEYKEDHTHYKMKVEEETT